MTIVPGDACKAVPGVQCILELTLRSDRGLIKRREVSRPFLQMLSVEKEGRSQDWSTRQEEGGGRRDRLYLQTGGLAKKGLDLEERGESKGGLACLPDTSLLECGKRRRMQTAGN